MKRDYTRPSSYSRANSAVIETRVPRELLAELAMFFHEHGDNPPRSISEMMRMTCELMRDIIDSKGMLTPVSDVVEATYALERIGLGKLQKGAKGTKSYYEALIKREELKRGDPFNALKEGATRIESKTDIELQEGMIQYWIGQGMTRDEARAKIALKPTLEEDFEEKEATKLDKLKDALAQGPNESTIIKEVLK